MLGRRALSVCCWALMFGCGGGADFPVGPTAFHLSGSEVFFARESEAAAARELSLGSACDFWTKRRHTLGAVLGAEPSDAMRGWVEARRLEACAERRVEIDARGVPGANADTLAQAKAAASEAEKEADAGNYFTARRAVDRCITLLRGFTSDVCDAALAKIRPQEEARRQAEAESRAAELRTEADEELKTGRCSQRHVDILRQVAGGIGQLFANMSHEYWRLDAHEIVVATPTGTSLKMNALFGGDTHMFAVSLAKVGLSAKDSKGYEVRGSSGYEAVIAGVAGAPEGQVASREGNLNPSENIVVTLTGSACTLVALAHKR